jgi:hypothetical protein
VTQKRADPARASGGPLRLHVLREVIVAIVAELRPSDTDMEQGLRRAITSVIRAHRPGGADNQSATTPQLTDPPDVGQIRVTVRESVATLAGTVRSLTEGRSVIAAWRLRGPVGMSAPSGDSLKDAAIPNDEDVVLSLRDR